MRLFYVSWLFAAYETILCVMTFHNMWDCFMYRDSSRHMRQFYVSWLFITCETVSCIMTGHKIWEFSCIKTIYETILCIMTRHDYILYFIVGYYILYLSLAMRNHSTADKQTLFFWAKKTLALLVFARTHACSEDQGEAELSYF